MAGFTCKPASCLLPSGLLYRRCYEVLYLLHGWPVHSPYIARTYSVLHATRDLLDPCHIYLIYLLTSSHMPRQEICNHWHLNSTIHVHATKKAARKQPQSLILVFSIDGVHHRSHLHCVHHHYYRHQSSCHHQSFHQKSYGRHQSLHSPHQISAMGRTDGC